jgi:hypothetical protein
MGEWRHSSAYSNLATWWNWMASFTPRPLYRQGKEPHYPLYCMQGLVGPRSGLDVWRKVSCPFRESSRDSSVVQAVARRHIDWAILAFQWKQWTSIDLLDFLKHFIDSLSCELELALIKHAFKFSEVIFKNKALILSGQLQYILLPKKCINAVNIKYIKQA